MEKIAWHCIANGWKHKVLPNRDRLATGGRAQAFVSVHCMLGEKKSRREEKLDKGLAYFEKERGCGGWVKILDRGKAQTLRERRLRWWRTVVTWHVMWREHVRTKTPFYPIAPFRVELLMLETEARPLISSRFWVFPSQRRDHILG